MTEMTKDEAIKKIESRLFRKIFYGTWNVPEDYYIHIEDVIELVEEIYSNNKNWKNCKKKDSQ